MSTTETEGAFTGRQSRQIFFRRQPPAAGVEPRGIIVVAHGFGEHSGRYRHVIAHLASEGFEVYAPDHHGHGRSEGPRARISLADAVADLHQLVQIAQGESRQANPDTFLLGHSMGGAIALRYAMAHQDSLNGLLLSGALAEVEGRELVKMIGKLVASIAPGLGLAKLDPNLVSRDPAVVRAYVEDPLVWHKAIPAGTIGEFLRHVETLPGDVPRITLPTLVMYGTADQLAAPSGSVMISERIGSGDLTTKAYEGLYHEILNEPEQVHVMGDISAWIATRIPVKEGT